MNIIIAAMNEAGSIDKWKLFGNRANPGKLYKSTVTRGRACPQQTWFLCAGYLDTWTIAYRVAGVGPASNRRLSDGPSEALDEQP
jgi:hypothetical protein